MKHKKLEAASYWPGYVDALVNVVLNILFMVGLMAVGLVILNVEAIANLKKAQQAEQLQKTNENNLLLAALGTLLAVLPKPTPASQSLTAAADASQPIRLRAPIALDVGQPFAVAPLNQEINYLRSKANVGASPFVLEFAALQYSVSMAQLSTLGQHYRTSPSGSYWMLWATVPDAKDDTARQAFGRMSSVRQALVQQGVKADAISLRIIAQEGTNFSNGRRIFLSSHTSLPANLL